MESEQASILTHNFVLHREMWRNVQPQIAHVGNSTKANSLFKNCKQLRMADHKIRTDFNIMNLVKLKTYLQEQGISASSYLKKGVSFVDVRV